ncbi:hypothetical protein PoB_004668600 [Plakobranchus ocellatus]|uniref:Uncharacterized protein n=1 Tax=Plakobranchus ocellatus TaxID=259542 RepID=A0AAV4BIB5_9GAST|nr:hypothetical protein PoB_004668600 [Plakobranchus ocellatus]
MDGFDLIDLNDPQVLQDLYATPPGPSMSTPFIEEFNSNSDSDLELEDKDMEEHLHCRRNTEPILRDSIFEVENYHEGDQTINIPANSTWTAGAKEFEQLPFTGVTGLQPAMENDSPFDFFNLLVTEQMIEKITQETNKRVFVSI